MTLRNLFIVNAVIALFFGLGFVLPPALLPSLYGVTLSPAAIVVSRMSGAVFLGNAVVFWFARNAQDSGARRSIVLGQFVHLALGFIVFLLAQLSGVFNPLGWFTVVLYLLVALGYGYFQFVKPSAS